MRFSMLWAIDALVALAPKRSTIVCSRSISLAWAAACLARRASSRSRWARYCEYVPLYSTIVPVAPSAPRSRCSDAGDGLVEQVQVVGDDEQGALVRADVVEHPRLGVGVEVVRRLVEHEDVAAGEQDAHQLDPAALAAAQRTERQLEAVVGQADAGGEAAHLALGGVATVHAEPFLGPAEPLDVAIGGVLLDAKAQLLHAVERLVEAATGQDVVERRHVVGHAVEAGVLRQVARGHP